VNQDAAEHYAAAFQHHLEQPVHNLCVAEARCIIARVETYDGAWSAIHRYVQQRGSLLLDEEHHTALDLWIGDLLLEEVIKAETDPENWAEWTQCLERLLRPAS
jgi:hypothetical protein